MSNFKVMVSSVSVIFDTGANYVCSSNKGDFVKLEEKKPQEISKAQQKVLRFMDLGLLNILSEVKVEV